MVYEINTAPERAPARFAIGDTVAGETIDPIATGRFFAHGTAGQDVVLVMETLGQRVGSVSLTVIDTVAPTARLRFRRCRNADVDHGALAFPRITRLPVFRLVGHQQRVLALPGPYRFWSYVINRAPEHRPAAMPLATEGTW